jgi:hypothetical protein
MNKVNTEVDRVETLLINALDGDFSVTTDPVSILRKRKEKTTGLIQDQGLMLRFDEMTPGKMYSFDMLDEDRIFTGSNDLLMGHPAEILGDESELFFQLKDKNHFRWVGYRRAKKPKGVAVLGKPDVFYEVHYRDIRPDGNGLYQKRLVPLDKNGKPLTAKIRNAFVCSPYHEGEYLITACSIIEDAHRANSMLATFKDGVEISLAVPLDDYKEIFFDREAPLLRNRKRAIIHWVAQHIRESKLGLKHKVKKHVRGVTDIVIDGLHVTIQPNGIAI